MLLFHGSVVKKMKGTYMKKKLFPALVIILSSLFFTASAGTQSVVLKVIADAANMRDGAGKDGRVLAVLKYGETVTYIENSGVLETLSNSEAPWIKIRSQDGKTGYIFGSLLAFASSSDGLAPYIEYSATPLAFSKKADLEKTQPERRYRYQRHWFTPKEMKLLSAKGFMFEKTKPSAYVNVDDMVDRYLPFADIRKTEQFIQTTDIDIPTYRQLPLYISSDYMLHCFHLVFDRMLENIESERLYPALKKLAKLEYEALAGAYAAERDPKLKKARFAAVCFAAVPYVLLNQTYTSDGGIDSDGLALIRDAAVLNAVRAECGYISAQKGPQKNAITGGKIDYSHFTVRGHYTHTPLLGSYFRAMIWYGTVYFPLNERPVEGIVLADTFRSDELMNEWNSINRVIERLVGRSDDAGPREYIRASDEVFGRGKSLSVYPEVKLLELYREKVAALSKSVIVASSLRGAAGAMDKASSLDGFRFMGQRFILDSRIFTLLTSPRVGDDAHPRNIPKGLDLFAVYGSPLAETLIKDEIAAVPRFRENYEKAKGELRGRDLKSPTVYESWIDLLGLHVTAKDLVRQRFTAAPEWNLRKLNAVHGSWAELRHDTILYAKPSAAECGGPQGEDVWIAGAPSIPRGYAEPDPVFFTKLSDLCSLLRDSCGKENLLSDAYRLKTDEFIAIASRLAAVAEKEAAGKAISDEDAVFLGGLNRTLASVVLPAGMYAEAMASAEKQMALIADIHTDYFSGAILHIAVGSPRKINIFVNDASGARVCEGYAFSYYEFTNPSRMTDEEWKSKVYDGDSAEWLNEREPAWLNVLPYTD
jgi:hypothetical protein